MEQSQENINHGRLYRSVRRLSSSRYEQQANIDNFPCAKRVLINYDDRITSESYPYKIVDVAHVINDPKDNFLGGRLSISISPGKKDHKWNRDLETDLDSIKNNGIRIIVCLLEWSEMKRLGISDYPKRAQEKGFLFYHMPVKDMGIPRKKEMDTLIPIMVKHLAYGENLLVHCRGGLGRAGTICACCLCHFGYDGINAIETVRKQRPGAVQTQKQEECVTKYFRELLG